MKLNNDPRVVDQEYQYWTTGFLVTSGHNIQYKSRTHKN